jgi:glucan phosphoethanolaminetransferase (alkaline phosphatase superfamily)
MNINKRVLPYLIVNIAAFYLLPMVIKDTGSAMAILLFAIPLICFITAIIFGIKHSFQWLYPIIIALLFIPTIFIFYNTTAWIYIIGYGVIAAAGNLIGKLFNK